jgi:hypothetical protein
VCNFRLPANLARCSSSREHHVKHVYWWVGGAAGLARGRADHVHARFFGDLVAPLQQGTAQDSSFGGGVCKGIWQHPADSGDL